MKKWFAAVAVFSFLLVAVLASPALGRIWTDRLGRTIEADFVRLDGDAVIVKRQGKEIRIPLEKLSDADQEYARTAASGTIDPSGDKGENPFAGSDDDDGRENDDRGGDKNGNYPLRTWRDKAGVSLRARFVAVEGQSVVLERNNRTRLNVFFHTLSERDQEYVERELRKAGIAHLTPSRVAPQTNGGQGALPGGYAPPGGYSPMGGYGRAQGGGVNSSPNPGSSSVPPPVSGSLPGVAGSNGSPPSPPSSPLMPSTGNAPTPGGGYSPPGGNSAPPPPKGGFSSPPSGAPPGVSPPSGPVPGAPPPGGFAPSSPAPPPGGYSAGAKPPSTFPRNLGPVGGEGPTLNTKIVYFCSNCSKQAPDHVKAGDRCPHCKVFIAYTEDPDGSRKYASGGRLAGYFIFGGGGLTVIAAIIGVIVRVVIAAARD